MEQEHLVEFNEGPGVSVAKVVTDSLSDDGHIGAFRRELQTFIDAHPNTALHLDLRNVEFFSSTVLLHLLELQSQLRREDGSLVIHGIHGNIKQIMKITGMQHKFRRGHSHAHQGLFHRA